MQSVVDLDNGTITITVSAAIGVYHGKRKLAFEGRDAVCVRESLQIVRKIEQISR